MFDREMCRASHGQTTLRSRSHAGFSKRNREFVSRLAFLSRPAPFSRIVLETRDTMNLPVARDKFRGSNILTIPGRHKTEKCATLSQVRATSRESREVETERTGRESPRPTDRWTRMRADVAREKAAYFRGIKAAWRRSATRSAMFGSELYDRTTNVRTANTVRSGHD